MFPFFQEDVDVEGLFLQSLVDIENAALDRKKGVCGLLGACCRVLAQLPGLSGATIAVTDGHGSVLHHLSSGTDFLLSSNAFENLRRLRDVSEALRDGAWAELPAGSSMQRATSGRLLSLHGKEYGMVFLQSESTGRSGDEQRKVAGSREIVTKLAPHLAKHIKLGLTRRERRLHRGLQKFATVELTPKVPSPKQIVESLSELFEADSCTLFVQELGKLYLSATNDPDVEPNPFKHASGQGLTDLVARTGRAVQIFDTADAEEVESATGLSEEAARPAAEKAALFSKSLHLLAIPLHSTNPEAEEAAPEGHSGPTDLRNGVLWITRSGMPFADYEKKALKQTCVALGSALSRAWKIYLSDSLWNARTEAIAISRYHPGKTKGQKGTSYLVDFDKAALDFFGTDNEEDLRGLEVSRLYFEKAYSKLVSDLAKKRQCGESEHGPINLRIQRLDGGIKPAAASYRLVTSPFAYPKIQYTASLLRDTSEREKVLAQHRRLVELLDERGIAYFAGDRDGKTRESSVAEQRMTGYSEEEIYKIRRRDLYPDGKNQEALYEEAKRHNGEVVKTVQELKHKNGTTFRASGSIRQLKDEFGKFDGFEGLYEDSSDKIRLQELLDLPTDRLIEDRKLYEKLKENTKLNLDYMTSLSHQIRTPLGALAQNLEDARAWIPEGSLLQKQMNYLMGQTRVCNMLAQNLSYIDRILKGESFEHKKIDLARMAIETKLNFKHTLRYERLDIQIDSKSINRVFTDFTGSPELFRQVMVNLFDNAIKYSKRGTVIEVSASPGRYAKNLNISNIGIPIPFAEIKKIFSRGHRNKKAAAKNDGTGLGLWIVQKIVDLHDCEISCSSESSTVHHPMEKVTFQLTLNV